MRRNGYGDDGDRACDDGDRAYDGDDDEYDDDTMAGPHADRCRDETMRKMLLMMVLGW